MPALGKWRKQREAVVKKAKEEKKPAISDEVEEEYEVEKIIDSRKFRGEIQYLIKWRNYDEDSNTWEKARNVNAPELVAEFEKSKNSPQKAVKSSSSPIKSSSSPIKTSVSPIKSSSSPVKRKLADVDDEFLNFVKDTATEKDNNVNGKRDDVNPTKKRKLFAGDDIKLSKGSPKSMTIKRKKTTKNGSTSSSSSESSSTDVQYSTTKKSFCEGVSLRRSPIKRQEESIDDAVRRSPRKVDIPVKYNGLFDEDDSDKGSVLTNLSEDIEKNEKKSSSRPKRSVAPKKAEDEPYIEVDEGEESDDSTKSDYSVERIIKSRVNKAGVKEYLLKWKNYPSGCNSWEPAKNLNCANLIEAYEEQQQSTSEKTKVSKLSSTTLAKLRQNSRKMEPTEEDDDESEEIEEFEGFTSGDTVPSKILSAEDVDGKLFFLAEIKLSPIARWIRNDTARRICPELLLDFYETNIAF